MIIYLRLELHIVFVIMCMKCLKWKDDKMILGIDLGTSNSMAGAYKDGKVVLVKTKGQGYTIPSVISMDEQGNVYVGDKALNRKKEYPDMTVDLFKRSMGTDETFSIGGRNFDATELSSILLKGIKQEAETFFKETIEDAVISVPAFFSNPQRQAVLKAGKMAGFNVKRIVNEPTAAAIAYGIGEDTKEKKIIIVLDLGGGTFDISVMEVNENVMEVVAICGDNRLGGNDFTDILINDFIRFSKINKKLSEEEKSILWHSAQRAKHQITAEGRGDIRCVIDGKEYSYSVSEDEYEKLCQPLLQKIRKLTIKAINESKYEPYEIDDIIMVGGGTKLSIVKKMVDKMMGKEINYKINPDEAVARGVAIQGALLSENQEIKDLVMTDICPYYVGCLVFQSEKYDVGRFIDIIVPKNTTIPARRTVKHMSWPSCWVLSVLLSNNEYGIEAVELDGVTYFIPDLKTERVEVHKTITYDVNGIIYVEVYIPATGVRYSKVIQDEKNMISQEETNKRLEQLKQMYLGIREYKVDEEILARAERVYTQILGRERDTLNQLITIFEQAINKGKTNEINKTRTQLLLLLDMLEGMEN